MLPAKVFHSNELNPVVAVRREFERFRVRIVIPWLVFFFGFTLTTSIGAVIIGQSEGARWGLDVMRHDIMGLNVESLTDAVFKNPDYWLILLICSLAPLAGAMLAFIFSPRSAVPPGAPRPLGSKLLLARVVFGLGIIWLLARVAIAVPSALQTIIGAWSSGVFAEHYRVRYLVMSVLSPQEFGLAYSGLLALLTLPLYEALVVRRSARATLECAVWLAAYWLLAVALVQKLLISYSLLLIGLSLCLAGDILAQFKRQLTVLAAFLLLIHSVMAALLPDWSYVSTIDHIIGRSADSYPYAIMISPKHDFGLGQYIVGSVLGGPAFLGEAISPNIEIYDLMYPNSDGAMAVPAPVWSYVDVGLLGAVLTMLLVMALCWFVSRLASHVTRSPWSWAIYIVLCVQIYHLTQMPIIGILFWSYGAIYCIVILALIWMLAPDRRRRNSLSRTARPA